MKSMFGKIVDGKLLLNGLGEIAHGFWNSIPEHFNNVELGEFIIMPNHMHGVIHVLWDKKHDDIENEMNLADVEAADLRPLRNRDLTKARLPKIIQQYKSSVTKQIHLKFPKSDFGWQRSYYDRIIRNQDELIKIEKYIHANPPNWGTDKYYNS